MTNQIVPSNGNALSVGDLSIVREVAARIRLMVQNGKQLNDNEAMALAQYSVATDLSPFVGECYYLPGIGPGPGIAGWRKKADEQLAYEARKAAEPMARFWCDYSDPTEGEVGKLNPGDLAVKATLHDTLTKNAWEKRTLAHFIEMMKNGIKDGAWEIAKEIAGNEPTWSAVGIVRANENFGGDKMPRYERACKRAEKAAIRKRFPRVHLPEPEGFDSLDVIDVTVVEHEQQPKRSEAELLASMGFAQPTPEPEQPPEEPAIDADLQAARDMKTPMGAQLGTLTAVQLEAIMAHSAYTPEVKAAAALILSKIDARIEVEQGQLI